MDPLLVRTASADLHVDNTIICIIGQAVVVITRPDSTVTIDMPQLVHSCVANIHVYKVICWVMI